MEVLSKRLKWLREKHRYSQKEIGDKIGMTVSGFQKFEYGSREPKLDVLVELAKLFNVSTDFLLGLTDETEELNELAFKAKALFIQKDKLEKTDHENRHHIGFLNEELMHLHITLKEDKNTLEFGNDNMTKDEIDYLYKRIDKIEQRIAMIRNRIQDYEKITEELQHESFNVSKEYTISVSKYIYLLLTIPNSKAHNSSFLNEYIMPITTNIQETLFETYTISINGKYFTSSFGEYKTLEDLEKEKIRIDEFLKVE